MFSPEGVLAKRAQLEIQSRRPIRHRALSRGDGGIDI
jgi:hypothetical protein